MGSRLPGILLLLLLTGCAARSVSEPPKGRRPVANVPTARATASAASSSRTAPQQTTGRSPTEQCLNQRPLLGVLRLVAAKPDCSGMGHLRMSFAVVETTGIPLRAALSSCPLYGSCAVLSDRPAKVGQLLVAALQPVRRPAHTVFCVRQPASDARVTCAVPVDGMKHAHQLLERFKPQAVESSPAGVLRPL